MFYFRGCIPKFISRMIYFRFLSPHLEVNPAKKDSPELKLANRHSEIQSTISVTEATRKETIRLLTPIEVLYSIESAIRLMIAGP